MDDNAGIPAGGIGTHRYGWKRENDDTLALP